MFEETFNQTLKIRGFLNILFKHFYTISTSLSFVASENSRIAFKSSAKWFENLPSGDTDESNEAFAISAGAFLIGRNGVKLALSPVRMSKKRSGTLGSIDFDACLKQDQRS